MNPDGHVLKLMRNKTLYHGYHYVKFGVSQRNERKPKSGKNRPMMVGLFISQTDPFLQHITHVLEGELLQGFFFFLASYLEIRLD